MNPGPDLAEKEDYPLEPAPLSSRKSFWSLTVVLAGFTFFTATMFAGARIGPAFAFYPDLLLLILTGNLLLGLYSAVLGWIAARTGLNTALLTRYSFGQDGSRISDLLLGFTQVGWYAWGTATMAILFVEMTGTPKAWTIPLMILFGMGFCLTAFMGYRGLDLLSKVAVPAMVVIIALSMKITFHDAAAQGGLLNLAGNGSMPASVALTLIIGTFISGATQATNWSRFAQNGRSAVLATLLAFFLGNGLMIFSGALTALVYREPDIVNVLKLQGLVFLGLAMLFLNIWTTQDNTIYNFSVSGCNFFRTNNRRFATLIGAAIGTLLAIGGMYDWLIYYLVFLGKTIPPIGGIMMADYLYRKGLYPGLISYLGGAAAGFLPIGIAPLNAVAAAFVLYLALSSLKVGKGQSF